MKRRKAETLAESVVSLAVFGIIMAGVCDFMSTQTNFIARTKKRDDIMYTTQVLMTSDDFWANINNNDDEITSKTSYDWDKDKKILKVKINNNDSMDFSLPK